MSERALLCIHALTGMHPGSGTALGTVDLPIQRERHTGWPVIPGSSLKGVLRDECRRAVADATWSGDLVKANTEDPQLTAVFGPAKVEADTSFAGSLSVTDARILAFPVRSLVGVFAWVTCPAVLERLQRDLSYVAQAGDSAQAAAAWPGGIPTPAQGQAVCSAGSPLLIDGTEMVLEEFEFTRSEQSESAPIADWIVGLVKDETTKARLAMCLVILHNDDFQHFVAHATEVVARVGLDCESKTAKSTALFYEEYLPPETLFYSLVAADARHTGGASMSAGEVLEFLKKNVPPFIQIGADETIGKGICAVNLVK
ncbi:MAG: type III-B CRISPR module RAMP protein Cmr4 [Thermoleophilia bacterium]|jgi:CRISPR-associated protein Cmr4